MILVWKIELLQGINLISNYVIWVKHIFAFHEVLIIVYNCYPLPVLAATLFYFCWKYAQCDRKQFYLIKWYYYVDHTYELFDIPCGTL